VLSVFVLLFDGISLNPVFYVQTNKGSAEINGLKRFNLSSSILGFVPVLGAVKPKIMFSNVVNDKQFILGFSLGVVFSLVLAVWKRSKSCQASIENSIRISKKVRFNTRTEFTVLRRITHSNYVIFFCRERKTPSKKWSL
jgi:hypothetical protein